MSDDASSAGDAIALSAPELARLWRGTRARARPDVWPGLADGLVEDVVLRIGDGLVIDGDPALVWSGAAGVVRLDARDLERSRAELELEWEILANVLSGACEALSCGDAVRGWIAGALAAARAGARTLGADGGPRGVLIVWWLSGIPSLRRSPAPGSGPR